MGNLVMKSVFNILRVLRTFYDVAFPYLVKGGENGVEIQYLAI